MIKAAIDLGSNSLKLLVAQIEGKIITPLLFNINLTRLGEKLGEDGILYPPALERTLAGLEELIKESRRLNTQEIILLGTQAVREAKTPDLKTLIQEKLGLPLTALSPEEEAVLSRRGALVDFPDPRAVIFDVGGKSCELAGKNFFYSLPLGAVSLTENFLKSDPVKPWEIQAARERIEEILWEVLPPQEPDHLVGVGGTIVTLAKMAKNLEEIQPHRLHQQVLTLEELSELNLEMARLTVEQRREIYRISSRRADIILGGGLLNQMMMECLGMKQIYVSVWGLTLGAMMDEDSRLNPTSRENLREI